MTDPFTVETFDNNNDDDDEDLITTQAAGSGRGGSSNVDVIPGTPSPDISPLTDSEIEDHAGQRITAKDTCDAFETNVRREALLARGPGRQAEALQQHQQHPSPPRQNVHVRQEATLLNDNESIHDSMPVVQAEPASESPVWVSPALVPVLVHHRPNNDEAEAPDPPSRKSSSVDDVETGRRHHEERQRPKLRFCRPQTERELWIWRALVLGLAAFTILAVIIVVALVVPSGKDSTSTTSDVDSDDTPGTEPPLVFKAFESTPELYYAVDAYLKEGESDRTKMTVAETYGPVIGDWNVSMLTDFAEVFNAWDYIDARHGFDEDLDGWDVSHSTTLECLFCGAISFKGVGLEKWDTSRVTDFSNTFNGAVSLTANLAEWQTGQGIQFRYMMADAISFNSDLSRWRVSNGISFSHFSAHATSFEGIGLDGWDMARAEDLRWMLHGSTSFNTNIVSWNVSNVIDFRSLFDGATSFQQDLCAWGRRMRKDAPVVDMFHETSCPSPSSPNLNATPPGPLCFDCS